VKIYSGMPLRQALNENGAFWAEVQRKALRLDAKINGTPQVETTA
jgi:hypothetical protein